MLLAKAKHESNRRIPTLDGWRGIAILLVMAGHYSPANLPILHGIGQHGVAIFFVLSGYLITTLLIEEQDKSGSISLRDFYTRRLFRIAPAAWFYLAVMVAVTLGKPFSTKEVLGSVFPFRNFIYLDSSHPVTAHFWSLAIEEQFYFVWPVLLILIPRRAVAWVATAAASLIALWRLAHWSQLLHQSTAFTTQTQYRADALFIGCALSLLMPRLRTYLRVWMIFPCIAALAACIIIYPAVVTLRESILIALLLALTSQLPTKLNGLLNWKPFIFMGAISYSLYLWQQPFWLFFAHQRYGILFALPLALGIACLSYYWIEKPMIQFGRSRAAAIRIRPLSYTAPCKTTTTT